MRPALAALLCLAAAPAAATYPVEMDATMNGLAIEVKASAGQPLVVTFKSADKATAVCKATVANAFDSPRTRTVTVKPGKSATASFKLGSSPNRVRVEASCEKAPAKGPPKS